MGLEEHAGQRHSELLLPMVSTVLAQARMEIRSLDAVAFGSGPGSFTGLRIACGVAQGLAAGAGVPVVGVGCLVALAQASGARHIFAALDARMDQIYCAAYAASETQAGFDVIAAPQLCSPEHAPQLPAGNWFGAGSGFGAHADRLAARYADRIVEHDAHLHPRAHEVAVLGARLLEAGAGIRPEDAHPLYLRDHVALTVAERRDRASRVEESR
jgi:tRNA threonylcarbamoyladenosine biosynthesis protein TsaB